MSSARVDLPRLFRRRRTRTEGGIAERLLERHERRAQGVIQERPLRPRRPRPWDGIAGRLPRRRSRTGGGITDRLPRVRGFRLTRRRVIRIGLAGLLALILVAGGYLWLRDSSLVAVDDLTVSGLTGPDAPRIRAALESAASDMTTLHVRVDQLLAAVQPYPVVKDLRVTVDKPHGMHIAVIEYVPVAVLEAKGERTQVAGDGTLLRGRVTTGNLPVLPVGALPGGARVSSGEVYGAVVIAAAAPVALRPLIDTVQEGPAGLEATLTKGPKVFFGSWAQATAKWAAAARVLADPDARGATYIDVRVPDRPVAGRFAPADGVVSGEGDPLIGAELDLSSDGTGGSADASTDGSTDGTDGTTDGTSDSSADGSTDASGDSSADGATDASSDSSTDGSTDASADGSTDGSTDSSGDANSASDGGDTSSSDQETGGTNP